MYLLNTRNYLIACIFALTALFQIYAMGQHSSLVNVPACSLNADETVQLQELTSAWQTFYKENDYRSLMAQSTGFTEGCGIIHDLKDASIFSTHQHETGCIADMTKIVGATEPHFHRKQVEVYFILQGTGRVVVGNQEFPIKAGDVVYIPKLTGHYTIPTIDLILGVVNIPYFDKNDLFDLRIADETTRTKVNYDHARYLYYANQKDS